MKYLRPKLPLVGYGWEKIQRTVNTELEMNLCHLRSTNSVNYVAIMLLLGKPR